VLIWFRFENTHLRKHYNAITTKKRKKEKKKEKTKNKKGHHSMFSP
jgi:regulator of replication initiation timing